MFHGPLVYLVGNYAGHTPFTEADIDLFLNHYSPADGSGARLKEEFLREARLAIYPQMVPDRADDWADRRVFEPLAWISFLYRKLIEEAHKRIRPPIIAGVVERGELREFSERVLLERIFRGLRAKGNQEHFNKVFGRTDLNSPHAVLERLGYTDSLLLAMILRPGQRTEPWGVRKYDGLRAGNVALPGESFATSVNFGVLQGGNIGFPAVSACYVYVTETTEPIRVEVFSDLGATRSARQRGECTCIRGFCRAMASLSAWTSWTSTPTSRPGSLSAYSKLSYTIWVLAYRRARSTTGRCGGSSSRPFTCPTATGSSVPRA